MEKANKTIRSKMLVHFGGLLSLLLILFGFIMYRQTRDTVVPLTKHLSQEVLIARSDEVSRLISSYLDDVHLVAVRAGRVAANRDAIVAEMQGVLSAISESDYEMFFYADREGNFVGTDGSEGNVGDRNYFRQVMEAGKRAFISQPVISRATGVPVFVAARPVIDETGERVGMIGATILLETLSAIAGAIRFGDSGFGYIVAPDGLLIAHPSEDLRMRLNLFESAQLGFVGLEEAARVMMQGGAGVITYYRPDGDKLVALYHPVAQSPGWILGVALLEDELMGPVSGLMRMLKYLLVGIIAAVLVVVVVISKRIAAPIHTLCESVKSAGSGALDQVLDIRTDDELESLAHAFNTMQVDLKNHIETLQRTTAEKERIAQDLLVANRIQASMLPRIFPPFPNISNLDLYASMDPAREVGGDFYDFYMIDDRRLCFCIGDVSGKGVSAALFMVITRTILKNQALSGNPLADIMRNTNDMLCDDNDESMFVTIFMGTLDVVTGEVEYVCAGHNPPLLVRREGEVSLLPVCPGVVVGVIADLTFKHDSIRLAPGDALFLYTDGVTEAMNPAAKQFTEQRLNEVVTGNASAGMSELIDQVKAAVADFASGAEQSDDITMLALRFEGMADKSKDKEG